MVLTLLFERRMKVFNLKFSKIFVNFLVKISRYGTYHITCEWNL